MSLPQARQRIAVLLAPLSGEAPFGSDARYDPDHESVRAEIAKLDSPGAGSVDWKKVVTSGSSVLSARSKDFTIAAYLAHALHEEEDLAGLLSGLALLHGLLDSAWEGMFPPLERQRARAAALGWFVTRASQRLSQANGSADHALLPELIAATEQLATLARARFGDGTPAMAALSSALLQLMASPAQPDRPPAMPAANASQPAPAPSPASGAGDATASSSTAATDGGELSTTTVAAAVADAVPQAVVDLATQRARLLAQVEDWLAPIAGAAPSGRDARYDPLHEELRAAIKQLDAPTGQPVEWPAVIRKAQTLLTQHSKDLLVAAYAAHGLYEERGIVGLTQGLAIVCGLLDRYWDGLYPDLKRSHKARAAALSFLLGRLSRSPELSARGADADSVAALSVAATWLSELVAERLDPEHRPAMRPLLDQVERLQLALQAPAPKAHTTPRVERPAAPARNPAQSDAEARGDAKSVAIPQAGAAPTSLENRAELLRYLASLNQSLAGVGKALRKQNLQEPLAYLLPRLGAALELDEAPPDREGRTFVPPPDAGELQEILGMLREQSWEPLLRASEALATSNPFLLDMQRLSHTALTRLGGEYAACAAIVVAQLGALLRRIPRLPELAFSDGTPFADADTRAFIAREVLAGASGAGGAPSGALGLDTEALDLARAQAVSGNKADALAAFEALARAADSGHARFRIRLSMASAAFAGGDPPLAAGLYATLFEELQARRLDEWEPQLAADCLAEYHECLVALGRDGREMAHGRALIYARLCAVDPRRALKVGQA